MTQPSAANTDPQIRVARLRTRFRAWLELARISNLPTVLSNAIAGATIGACALALEKTAGGAGTVIWFGGFVSTAGPDGPQDPLSSPAIALGVLAPLALPLFAYVGGMILNDAFDAEIDARERPTRPIPSGRVSRTSAFIVGFALLSAAIALACTTGLPLVIGATALLVAAIVIYDRFHTKSVASTLLLAACRALASLIPMLAFAHGDVEVLVRRGAFVLPFALAAWTLGLSLLAREEVALRMPQDAPGGARGSEDATPLPCPKCGQLMVGGYGRCAECASPSSAPERRGAIARRSNLRARLLLVAPTIAVAAMLAAFFTAHVALLNRGRGAGDTLAAGNPGAAIVVAIILALVAVRAAQILRREPARTPDAIGMLIACLALIDAMALATGGHWLAALVCLALFALTRRWQRVIAGS
jgi:hypothetical protein